MSSSDNRTAAVMARFNAVFQSHDPGPLADLVADDCIVENTTPAPDGARFTGRAACVELWTRIATTPNLRFDQEDTIVLGERAIILWKMVWGDGPAECVRGVNLMRLRDGLIVEARGYVKA